MADSKGDVSLIITADIKSLEDGLNQAGLLVKNRMDSIASTVKSSLAGVAATIAAAFAFKELKDFVNGVAEARAKLQELSEVTGTSVENLSRISSVAKVVGTDMTDVATALVKLTKGLATGDGETGKAANALENLGIKARNADGSLRDAGDLYLEVAKRFAELDNGAGKTALALDLFGKAGAAQIPTLNAIGQAGDLVVKVTGEQAEAAEQYERDLKRLEIQLGANKKIIAGEFITALDDATKAILETIKQTGGLTDKLKELAADGSLEEFGRDVLRIAGFIGDAFLGVINIVKLTGDTLGGVAAAATESAQGIAAQLKLAYSNPLTVDKAAVADADQHLRLAGKIIEDMNARTSDVLGSGSLFRDALEKQFKGHDALKDSGIDFGKGEEFTEKSNYTGTGKAQKTGRLEDTSKAEYAVAKAQFEAALNLQKEYLKEAQAGYDEAYKHNLISIEEYYADRIRTEQAAVQLEIDSKNQEIAAIQKAESTATTDRERLTLKAQEIKLTGELTVLTAQYAQVAITETRAMTEAERQRADGLKNLQIQSQINVGNSQVAMDRIALNTRRTLRQESDAQAIQDEIGFENRLTEIQRDAIQQRIELERAGTNDPVKIAALNAQIEDLERTHQEKLTELDAQATIERQKYATAFASQAQDAFATFFNDITDRTKKLSDTFKALGQNLLKAFNDVASKKFAEQLLGSGTQGGGILNSIASQLFPASGAGAARPPAAGAGGGADASAQALDGLSTAAQSTSASMETLSSGGIAGMFKSATSWIAKQLTGTVTEEAKTTATQTGTSALTSLTEAAYSAARALSSVGSGGGGSGGSGSGDFLSGLLGSSGSTASANTGTALASDSALATDASYFADMGVVPYLADGTNFVPQDMLAMIHKGEKVVPAKYNHDDTQRGATIHQTINVPPSLSRASSAQTAGVIGGATASAVRRNS